MRNGTRRKRKNETRPGLEPSGGNVFADLGLRDADDLLAKAEIAHRLCSVIQARRLTQTQAAELLGIDQPKVSALMRGRLAGFSTDLLFRLLNALGQSVVITIRPGRPARTRTRIVSG